MTISMATELTFVLRQDDHVVLTSANYPEEVAFSLAAPPAPQPGAWRNYAAGAVVALREKHNVRRGLAGTLRGALPGGGLSSSASVILAYLHALAVVNDLTLEDWEYVRLVQRVENGYLGLQNGILDQATIVFGRANTLLHIDTQQRQVTALRGPAPSAYELLIAFSGQTRALVSSDYNNRVRARLDAFLAMDTNHDAPGHFISYLCRHESVYALKAAGARLDIGSIAAYHAAAARLRRAT
jgi:galactokinase/galacturonokinase